MIPIVAAESATQLGADVRGAVLVVGSHGGIIAAYLAASAGARAVILNDAGVGKDAAGIAGLAYLGRIGTAAATVAHTSARIGDGVDALERGVISHANALAAALGVVAGMPCGEAAERLRGAPPAHTAPPPYSEGRYLLRRRRSRGLGARLDRQARCRRRGTRARHRLARRPARRTAGLRARRRCARRGIP